MSPPSLGTSCLDPEIVCEIIKVSSPAPERIYRPKVSLIQEKRGEERGTICRNLERGDGRLMPGENRFRRFQIPFNKFLHPQKDMNSP